MNANTVMTIFKNLHSGYKISDDTVSYILKWFQFQDKMEHTEEQLTILIENIYNFYEDGVDTEDLRFGEYTLPDILFEIGLIDTSDERYKYEMNQY